MFRQVGVPCGPSLHGNAAVVLHEYDRSSYTKYSMLR